MEIQVEKCLDGLDDRLAGYSKVLRRRDMCDSGFVVEGVEPVVRLLKAERFKVDRVLCVDSRIELFLEKYGDDVLRNECEVLVAEKNIVNEVAGYKFTRGVMAIGRQVDEVALADIAKQGALLVCEHVENEENLGVMIRTAAALGMEGVLLGEKGVSPFARRVIRVSMGNVFNMPIVRSQGLVEDLKKLKGCGYTIVGAALDKEAVDVGSFECAAGQGVALVMGNEPSGLSQAVLDVCDVKVVIPIKKATDSLNVSVAAGILMYELRSLVNR